MLSLRPELVRRYVDLLVLLRRHAGPELLDRGGLLDVVEVELPDEDDAADGGDRPSLAQDLEDRGPAYVKFGQLLATRADLLPPAVIDDLARLHDDLAPIPFEDVRQIVEDELGGRLSNLFATFEEEPLATASLGQVHRAAMRDGTPVAVKVQRPDIRERLRPDIQAFEELAAFLEQHTRFGDLYRVTQVVEQFRTALSRELDYRREARNLTQLADNLAEFDRLRVPGHVEDYTTSRVLTMELVEGTKVTEVSDLRKLELDGASLVDELFRGYLKQIMVDGFVHADPHPGNVLLTDDDELALLDLGMVLRIEPDTRKRLLRLTLGVSEHDVQQAADAGLALCARRDDFDEELYRRRIADVVGAYHDLPPEDLQLGLLLMEVARVAGETGLRPPPELTLLGRTLLALDQCADALAPDFDVNRAIERHLGELLTESSAKELTPGRMLQPLLDAKEFTEQLPGRANRILDALAEGELRVNVDAVDEEALLGAIRRLGNRLTAGLVVAALIIGAAMLMRVETAATLFGYPALAIIFFLVAAVGGIVLAATAFLDSR